MKPIHAENDSLEPVSAKKGESEDWHERWVRVSEIIFSSGVILAIAAKIFLGREFETTDRFIGPLLIPLSVVWALAISHMVHTRLRGHLSTCIRAFFYAALATVGVLLFWLLVFDGISRFIN